MPGDLKQAKTKSMIFEEGPHTQFNFMLNNTQLEIVTEFKHLGVHFCKDDKWYRTQRKLAQRSVLLTT